MVFDPAHLAVEAYRTEYSNPSIFLIDHSDADF